MALNSKRMQTFFNEFLITTTNFLNQFTSECESKFLEYERKLNRIESNLIIIEAKLDSVPLVPLQEEIPPPVPKVPQNPSNNSEIQILKEEPTKVEEQPVDQTIINETTSQEPTPEVDSHLIKISDSFYYKKFFKMLKFGVPPAAVKLKMISEGLEGDKLDNPDLMIEKCPEDSETFEE